MRSPKSAEHEVLGVVANVHGEEVGALAVAKAVRGVPNTRVGIANVQAVAARKRGGMTPEFPGDPRSRNYETARASMVVSRFKDCTHVVEVHGSAADEDDVIWVSNDPISRYATEWETLLRIALLLPQGARRVVMTTRRFNLFGALAQCALLDVGTKSPLLDPEYCRQEFDWLANEAADTALPPEIELYQHVGMVPIPSSRRVGLPTRLANFEPIDPEKAEALGLPKGARALTWGPDLPAAGEVVIPCPAPYLVGGDAIAGGLVSGGRPW